MIQKGTNGYYKDKYIKSNGKRLYIYKNIFNNYYFEDNEEYIIKNKKIYKLIDETIFLSKSEIIKRLGFNFYQNNVFDIQKTKYENNCLNGFYSFLKTKRYKPSKELLDLNIENVLSTFQKIYQNINLCFSRNSNKNIKTINLNEAMEFEKFSTKLIKYLENENIDVLDYIKKFVYLGVIPYKIEKFIGEIFKNELINIKYSDVQFSKDTRLFILKNISQNLIVFEVNTGEKLETLTRYEKDHSEILKFFDLEENKIFKKEILYHLFNKDKNLENIVKKELRETPPKWARKFENKKIRLLNKKEIKNKEIELIGTIPYKKNGTFYY